MLPPANPELFHIPHVDNLPGILRGGGLWCDEQRLERKLSTTNIGLPHIKQRRLQRPVTVAAGGMLGQYVPFNFCRRSVMLYVVHRGHKDYEGGQERIVHLVSSVRTAIATGRPWAFTDRHAELAYARYYDDLAHLHHVDWDVMPREQWGGNDEVKSKRQAEFLVHEFFPWPAIEQVAVHNQATATRVHQAFEQAHHRPQVTVRRDWYY